MNLYNYGEIENGITLSSLISMNKEKCQETELIEEYLLRQLDSDFSGFSKEKKQLFMKNYIYMSTMIIMDLREIDTRIAYCKKESKKLDGDKSNEAEYRIRKIQYFSRINKEAKDEIVEFLHNKLKDYILEHTYDILKRAEDRDELSMLFLKGRYKFAEMHDYYNINFDFSTYAKVNYLPDVDLIHRMKTTANYLKQKKENPTEYYIQMKQLVDDKQMMQGLATRIEKNYYLTKRKDLFNLLVSLFEEKNYQAFIALGLLQLEGVFYDYCLVKFGEKDNMGTLVEKVDKSFNGNEKMVMFYYPYFAFDVPIMRNEIAHKGIIDLTNIEEKAYYLILDLNSVIKMVEDESTDKLKLFFMIFEELVKIDSSAPDYMTKLNKQLFFELLANKFLTQNYFWQLLKEPERYKEEILFYAKDNLPEGYADATTVVPSIAGLLKNEEFWIVVEEEVNKCKNINNEIPKELYDLALLLKNDYIGILKDNAKQKCIELSAILSKVK